MTRLGELEMLILWDSLRLQMPSILPATPMIAAMITHPPVI